MRGHPIKLDDHRPASGRIAVAIRRRRHDDLQDDAALVQRRLDQLEEELRVAPPAETWPEALQCLRDLALLMTLRGSDGEARWAEQIHRSVDDIARLAEQERWPS